MFEVRPSEPVIIPDPIGKDTSLQIFLDEQLEASKAALQHKLDMMNATKKADAIELPDVSKL